jgi:two-component system, LytTR family, sensor kinase
MIYIPVSFISVYTAIYFLLPRYILKEKYFSLFLMLTGLTIFYFSLAWLLMMMLADITTNVPFNQLPVSIKWFQPIRYGIGLPLTSAVFVTIIKLLKHWHLEQKENELLQRQKINTELQLLKTQFQPNFLYDALQHIFYLIHKHSPQSPDTVLKLSDLLSYILYENEKDHVPLEKEIQIIKTYLSLKKTFYADRLWVQLKEQGETTGMNIAPLLLVSLVESCLEKFLRTPAQQLNLSLDIKTENGELYFLMECKNNFENELAERNDDDKWIKSLKRIEMLYPGKHSFDVYSENGTTNLLLVLEGGETSPFIVKEKEEFVLS